MTFLLLVWQRWLLAAFVLICGLTLFTACQENLVEPAYFGTITGTVLDARNNQPLANATVTTNPATSSYLTDAAGKFTIENVPAGRVAITISRTDYQQVVANVTITDGQNATVSVVLSKSTTAAPTPPNRPTPANQATGQPTTLRFSWRPVNATASDSLRYDVVLYESNNLNQRNLLTNSKDTSVTVTSLRFNTTYYWQVTVRNTAGASARGPVWSFQTATLPNNRYVFARASNNNIDVYSSNDVGSDLIRLTSDITVETAPQLSPTGDLIAYISNIAGPFQLYTMNRDGSNNQPVTSLSVNGNGNEGFGYRWSPDGSQFIFSHNNQLWLVNRNGSGLRPLPAAASPGYNFRECDWTDQNGGRLVVQTVGSNPYDSDLYLYNLDGTNPVQLIPPGAPNAPSSPRRLSSPSFSPDGRSVVYTRDESAVVSPTGRQSDVHIFTRRLDGSSPVDLSIGNGSTTGGKQAGFNDLYPRYTANGAQLVFVYVDSSIGSTPNVYKMDLNGSNRTKIIDNATLPDNK